MRFTLEKKMVAQVRYYETLYVIRDGQGERVYTGTDEKTAHHIQRLLNGCRAKKAPKRKKRVKSRRK